MNPLRKIKLAVLESKGLGLAHVIARSNWRQQRLLILCYHGVSMGAEHLSHPEMFLAPITFARRMKILAESGCHVLSLSEALRLLQLGKLPPASVAITFDDGWADFRQNAFPVLRQHGFPATVYLTTYHCLLQRPLFRFALAHIMYQRQSSVENRLFPELPGQLDLRTEENRTKLLWQIDSYAKQKNLSGREKDDLAAEFANSIGFDYSAFRQERIFQLMNPEEVGEMARAGIDFQLHTHRHRTPLERSKFVAEINDNRRLIEEMTGARECVHFCYPSGANRSDFLPWLKEAGVQSATTCEHGFVTTTSNSLLLPRLLDQYRLSDAEYEGWLSGLAAFMPKRQTAAIDVAPE